MDCSLWDDKDDEDDEDKSTPSEDRQTSQTIAQSPVEEFSWTWDANAFVDRLMNISGHLKTVKVILLQRESLVMTDKSIVIVERGPNSDTASRRDINVYWQQRLRDAVSQPPKANSR